MQERPLGCWESGFRSAHDMLSGTMLVVSCADIQAEYDFSKIQQSCHLLFKAHPLLQAAIEVRGFNAYFVLKTTFEDISITEINRKKDWQSQFSAEIHQPLEAQQYLWRVSALPTATGFKLFLITHHAIADAISQANLLEQFLEIYNTLIQNLKCEIKVWPLLKNVEANLKSAPSWDEFSANYEAVTLANIDQIAYETAAPIQERTSTSTFIKVDSVQLKHLLKKCKQNQVTLNSLLNAVMLKTQIELNPGHLNACLKTPVNLRKYCDSEMNESHIGCYLSIVETLHDIADKDLWTLAKEYQQQLRAAIPKLGFLPRVIDYNEVDIALVTKLFAVGSARRRKHLPNTFGVSNIGRLSIKTTFDHAKLNDFVFNTNHLVGNYYMFVSALTLQDELNLIFAYVTPLISDANAKRFIDVYLQKLNI